MMITVSVCMIVKNEETNLDRCLGSLKTIADEIIVVDTGSTDRTKEIAHRYTDRVYDYQWTGSFSDARNYSFSLASCDYIYQADADEELDETNIERFRILKEAMLPEIEIVQMYYCNQLQNNTIYSYDRELRPKLYKRVRNWMWEETIHEAVRLEPVIYDSDVEIIHRPGEGHAARDLAAFRRLIDNGEKLSRRLVEIYAKELWIAGDEADLKAAADYFHTLADEGGYEGLEAVAFAVSCRCSRAAGDMESFMKYALRATAGEMICSELCCELGDYYRSQGDEAEARLWYYNALHETEAVLDIRCGDQIPRDALTLLGDMV